MPVTLSLTLVVSFSFLVSGLLRRTRARRLASSTVYLAVGVLSGPEVFGILDEAAIRQLAPFIAVTLGVVGFIQGLPLTARLRRARELEAGGVTAGLGLAVVGGAAFVLLEPLVAGDAIYPALTLGAAAVATSRPVLRSTIRQMEADGEVSRMVVSMALLGDVLAVLLSGLALAVAVADASAGRLGLGPLAWILTSCGIGIASGLLFRFFITAESARLFLATVGVIMFTSGLATTVGISALLLNAVAGVTVALTGGREDRAEALRTLEAPASIALMIFAGAMWSASPELPVPALLLPVAAAGFALTRGVALAAGGRVAVELIPRAPHAPRIGYGLLPMGGVAIAIAVNYRLLELPGANLVLGAVAGAAILTELVAFNFLSVLLVDAGEVRELERANRRIG